MELAIANQKELAAMRQLYRDAFPPEERKPFSLLIRQARRGCAELLAIREGGRFCGMMIPVFYRDMVLLDYFAVTADARGQGVGARALALLRARYAKKRIFLEIEHPARNAKNDAQRQARKAFYLKNGLRDAGLCIKVYRTEMELLFAGEQVAFEEYCALLRATLGLAYYWILRPRRMHGDS